MALGLACRGGINNSLRVTARNVSASTVDLAAAPLAVQVVKRRLLESACLRRTLRGHRFNGFDSLWT
jgi:hypothetical protein